MIAIAKLLVLGLNLAFLAEDQRVLAIRVRMLCEAFLANRMATDECQWVGFFQIFQAGETG